MENTIAIPRVSFYFIRHGETDWNKKHQVLCSDDDIALNQTGLLQIADICPRTASLHITHIFKPS